MVQQLFFEDMSIGQSDSITRTITAEMIEAFAEISGDVNPLHLDAEYAATTRFGERIAHGALTASFISAVLGTRLPGIGAVFMHQSTKFLAPVRIGDTVVASAEVTAMEKNRVSYETKCMVGDKIVVAGDALVYVPSRPNA
ncbi:MaoC family dehydratase [Kordiimonas lacus]|uniref:3-hydroxybutyryl-CoA dehydratase n=1 Tax=Kordiimonas lacus TaxID=637679 RepID=A0A1G6XWT7_9PROT|nr:MaoC family dehydratase [Kordiimonas lacus]SDD82492.1 3-hydroxybutyryl-CoA dehydratase [Kordiimonas lacus]